MSYLSKVKAARLLPYANTGLTFVVIGSLMVFLLYTDLPTGLTESECGLLTCWPLKVIHFLDDGRAVSYWNQDVVVYVLRLKYLLLLHIVGAVSTSFALSFFLISYLPSACTRFVVPASWLSIQFVFAAALILLIAIYFTLDFENARRGATQGSAPQTTKTAISLIAAAVCLSCVWLPWHFLLFRQRRSATKIEGTL